MSARMRLTQILNKKRPKTKPLEYSHKRRWNILRGDRVQVIGNHPERGKQGKVLEVIRKIDKVIVDKVHMKPKHHKGDPERGIPARMEMLPRPIPYSNVNLVDPETGLPTRVNRKFLEDGTKVRIAKRSGAIIPRPDILTIRRTPISSDVTESCTADEKAVWEITYEGNHPYPPNWPTPSDDKEEEEEK